MRRDRVDSTARDAPLIVFSTNSAWNIVNFRKSLVRTMQQTGFRIVALVPANEDLAPLKALGVEVIALPMSPRGASPLADTMLTLRYLAAFRRLRPVAFFGFTAKPNIYGGMAARLLGIPVVSNITGLGTGFLSGRLLERLMSALYRTALRRSRRVFFHNRDDLDLFVGRGLVSAAQAERIPGSGIDLDRFAAAPWPGGPLTFLFVGRLLIDKGVMEFVEAAAAIKPQLGDARFLVVGDWAPHPRAAPRARLDEIAADGAIELVGGVADVRPCIAGAHCVVLPSYREGLPRVLLEASAMARPSIAADVPGCREAVDPGATGLLCEARSAAALGTAMLAFAALSDAERRAMGEAARRRAEALFGEDQVNQAYHAAMQQISG